MKTIYYVTDVTWHPMINVYRNEKEEFYRRDGSKVERTMGCPLELEDDVADSILKAYEEFDKAHNMLNKLVREKDTDVR